MRIFCSGDIKGGLKTIKGSLIPWALIPNFRTRVSYHVYVYCLCLQLNISYCDLDRLFYEEIIQNSYLKHSLKLSLKLTLKSSLSQAPSLALFQALSKACTLSLQSNHSLALHIPLYSTLLDFVLSISNLYDDITRGSRIVEIICWSCCQEAKLQLVKMVCV